MPSQYGYRAFNPPRIFGDLMLAQPCGPCQFLLEELN
jgi:hypothetical protein